MRSMPNIPWPVVAITGIVATLIGFLVWRGQDAVALIGGITAAVVGILGAISASAAKAEQRASAIEAKVDVVATQTNGINTRAQGETTEAYRLMIEQMNRAQMLLAEQNAIMTRLALAAPPSAVDQLDPILPRPVSPAALGTTTMELPRYTPPLGG
jgi:rhamnose utilization protein RhaD (predicted bifunctional aldolase and dehydrogenase)